VSETATGVNSAQASLAAAEAASRQFGDGSCTSHIHGTGDQRLHYVRAGQGPVIIFVHGFPSFWYCWIRQIANLRRDFTCIALDAPGAGASGRPAELSEYRVPALAARLADFISAIVPDERVVLVGHDWGAALGFALAQARPDLIAGVCGIAAPPYGQFLDLFASNPAQQARSHYMEGLRTMTAERAAAAAPQIGPGAYAGLLERGDISAKEHALFAAACGDPAALAGGAAWYGANICAPGEDPAPLAWPAGNPALTMPAQLIWGEADETFVAQAPDQFLARNPRASVFRLAGIGHWCMLQADEQCSAAIAAFATKVHQAQEDIRS
jgi:pimeloyl-ACP methyl ester carboxylesterase